jgi:4-aminobutyrate aminotransferase-like enzyme
MASAVITTAEQLASGRRYLDFSTQLVFTNLGHQHPRSSRPSRSKPTDSARLHPLTHLIVHVAPPLKLSDADAATGLAILDEALSAADRF